MRAAKRHAVRRAPEDQGSPERARQAQGLVLEPLTGPRQGAAAACRARARIECRLDQLRSQGLVTRQQAEAGLRFRRHHLAAGRQPKVTMSYGPRGDRIWQDQAEPGPDEIAVDEALGLLAPDGRRAVLQVCCLDGEPPAEIVVLHRALDRLAKHWGVPADA
ncbi:hypothetical protein E9232_002612 [Inquilinus ginsengisoli]|uniref:Uncharacterized protein n=1 Tax=Inquilinus ginsengisoli TaxID=363840 RepID=A0ABU1JN93_9PROT|nr:hypothetical protein [Inquilinus ginsengisoli]MDR6290091.1 hypothetical protein [Inquilinus ginsengisoli]